MIQNINDGLPDMVQYDIFRKHRGNHKVDPLLILGFPGLKMRSLFLGEKSQVLIQGFLEIIPSVLEIGFDLRLHALHCRKTWWIPPVETFHWSSGSWPLRAARSEQWASHCRSNSIPYQHQPQAVFVDNQTKEHILLHEVVQNGEHANFALNRIEDP